jgi:hypothetical protein
MVIVAHAPGVKSVDVALAGRPAECEELSRLLARAVDSLSGVLTLRREAEAGKAALLVETAAVATAAGLLAAPEGPRD